MANLKIFGVGVRDTQSVVFVNAEVLVTCNQSLQFHDWSGKLSAKNYCIAKIIEPAPQFVTESINSYKYRRAPVYIFYLKLSYLH